jgi:hypothetical protein
MSDDVTADDLESYIQAMGPVQICGQWGRGYNREIKVDLARKWFTVYDHGVEIAGTSFASTAAEAYNGIKPREVKEFKYRA